MHAPEPHRQGQSIVYPIDPRAQSAHTYGNRHPPGHGFGYTQQAHCSRAPSRLASLLCTGWPDSRLSRFVLITEPPPRRVRSPAMGGVTLKGWRPPPPRAAPVRLRSWRRMGSFDEGARSQLSRVVGHTTRKVRAFRTRCQASPSPSTPSLRPWQHQRAWQQRPSEPSEPSQSSASWP